MRGELNKVAAEYRGKGLSEEKKEELREKVLEILAEWVETSATSQGSF